MYKQFAELNVGDKFTYAIFGVTLRFTKTGSETAKTIGNLEYHFERTWEVWALDV